MCFKKVSSIFILVILLSACETDKNMQFSQWRTVNANSVDLNLAEFSPVKITNFQIQDRDNAVRNSKYMFEGSQGVFEAQRVIGAWFDIQSENSVKPEEALFNYATQGEAKIDIDKTSLQKINHIKEKSVGHYGYGKLRGTDRECIIALGGYRLRPSAYDNDMNEIDTIISFVYCGDNVRSKDFNTMLSRVNLRGIT